MAPNSILNGNLPWIVLFLFFSRFVQLAAQLYYDTLLANQKIYCKCKKSKVRNNNIF